MRPNVGLWQFWADSADKNLPNSFLGSSFLGVDFATVESVSFLSVDLVNGGRVLEQDKPEAFRLAEFVQLDRGLLDRAKLGEIFLELLLGRFPRQAVDEEFSVVVFVHRGHNRVLVPILNPIFSHISHDRGST